MDHTSPLLILVLLLLSSFHLPVLVRGALWEEGFESDADVEPMDGKLRNTLDGRIVGYMQPPYSTNHASFIEQIPGTGLIVAWFSGTSEGENDTSIVVSSLASGSDQFTTPVLVSRRSGYSNQNPVLYFDDLNQNLHLFHSQQVAASNPDETHATVWELQSQDNGTRWSTPRLVFATPGSFDRNRLITLNDGQQWLLPLYNAAQDGPKQYSQLAISNDFGETWDTNTISDSTGLVQPTLFLQPGTNNNLIGFFRDRNAKNIYTSTSTNGGNSFTKPEKTSLPNNDCAIQSIALASGNVALVFNDVAGSKTRTPLTIALSEDNGQTWAWQRNLEPRPDNFTSGEFFNVNEPSLDYPEYSYPSLIEDEQGQIHVVYTYNRATIKYVQIDEAWIKTPDSDELQF